MIAEKKKNLLRRYSKKNLDKSDVLVVFTKYPYPGKAKTRLAKSIGNIDAAYFSLLCTKVVLGCVESGSFNTVVFYTPQSRESEITQLVDDKFELFSQETGNLGKKLSHAFKMMFGKGAERVIVIGTDCPLISNKVIRKAFEKLRKTKCVVGPSLDGGYYLLGLSSFDKKVFQDVDWGTNKVLKQTETNLKSIAFPYCLLEENFDIDRINDILLLREKLEGNKDSRFAPLVLFLKRCLYG